MHLKAKVHLEQGLFVEVNRWHPTQNPIRGYRHLGLPT